MNVGLEGEEVDVDSGETETDAWAASFRCYILFALVWLAIVTVITREHKKLSAFA